jgi:hypothetical protein
VDVAEDTVEISLIFDVPMHFADEQRPPTEMISDDLDERILFHKLREILGRPVETIYRGQVRYTRVVRSQAGG